ncbi:MAG TPA: UPF0158 family protein [Candidatus Eisenbacteria bacterium]|jgi:hypothetical protein
MTPDTGSRSVVVALRDVVDQMDLPSDEMTAYLNRRTGELVVVTDTDRELAEEEEEPTGLPDWQKESVAAAREVMETGDFLELPDKFEINEYGIIERFCHQAEPGEAREALLRAIAGRGAFRYFKDVLHDRGMTDAWYAFRHKALEEIAAAWLDENGIAYTRESPSPGGA